MNNLAPLAMLLDVDQGFHEDWQRPHAVHKERLGPHMRLPLQDVPREGAVGGGWWFCGPDAVLIVRIN